jgi:hypothetical protein
MGLRDVLGSGASAADLYATTRAALQLSTLIYATVRKPVGKE